MASYQHLFRSKDCPGTMQDWMKQKDTPTIRIHITAFSDATCIGFTIPHIFCDVPGLSVIMRAWCSILAGRESELPALIIEDPIAHIGGSYPSSKKERKKFYADMQGGYHIAGFWAKVRFYTPLVKEFVLHPKEENRLVFLPTKTLEKLRQVALTELQDEKEAWVSENDIIVALIIKVSFRRLKCALYLWRFLTCVSSSATSTGKRTTRRRTPCRCQLTFATSCLN